MVVVVEKEEEEEGGHPRRQALPRPKWKGRLRALAYASHKVYNPKSIKVGKSLIVDPPWVFTCIDYLGLIVYRSLTQNISWFTQKFHIPGLN